ncbi:MAG: hypothetical protein HQL31_05275, partial [Planctomycetes bacterium]|nr:hypothetical protein [Planctomycetota bacterium]
MDELLPNVDAAQLLGLWPHRVPVTGNPKIPFQIEGGEHEEKSAEQEALPRPPQRFSEADIDILLKQAGININARNRELALFLLRHHVQLEARLFGEVLKLFPVKNPDVNQAGALMAALAKLPIESIASGYKIILSSLNGDHPTVMSALKYLNSLLTDLASQSFTLKEFKISPDLIRGALEQELKDLQRFLSWKPQDQIKLLVAKKLMLVQLHRVLRLFENLLIFAEPKDKGGDPSRFCSLLQSSASTTRQAIHVLLTDAILSREDLHHHLMTRGACHSLALHIGEQVIPGRLWAQDGENPAAKDLDSRNIKLFFRWFTHELGITDAHV